MVEADIKVNAEFSFGECIIDIGDERIKIPYLNSEGEKLSKEEFYSALDEAIPHLYKTQLIVALISQILHRHIADSTGDLNGRKVGVGFQAKLNTENELVVKKLDNLITQPKPKQIKKIDKKVEEKAHIDFYENHLKDVAKDYDDIYILSANSGEIYAFVAYLAEAFIRKNKSKKPLFVPTLKYHCDILDLFLPQYDYCFVDAYLETFSFRSMDSYWEHDGHNFYFLYNNNHFSSVNTFPNNVDYFSQILRTTRLTMDDCVEPKFVIKDDIKGAAISKVGDLDINLDNFVILTPEASTFDDLPPEFWQDLIKTLKQKGYDVFVNLSNPETLPGVKTVKLEFSEIFYFATLSKAVVSLRSGLNEFLIPSETPIISLISNCFGISSKDSSIKYSVKNLPYIYPNKVQEILTDKYECLDVLVADIVQKIQSIKDRNFSS